MTETSLLPKIAEAAGYDFGQLCDAIVDLATATRFVESKILHEASRCGAEDILEGACENGWTHASAPRERFDRKVFIQVPQHPGDKLGEVIFGLIEETRMR